MSDNSLRSPDMNCFMEGTSHIHINILAKKVHKTRDSVMVSFQFFGCVNAPHTDTFAYTRWVIQICLNSHIKRVCRREKLAYEPLRMKCVFSFK
jgi:hypothetical protein